MKLWNVHTEKWHEEKKLYNKFFQNIKQNILGHRHTKPTYDVYFKILGW